jgi:hypothetical protein
MNAARGKKIQKAKCAICKRTFSISYGNRTVLYQQKQGHNQYKNVSRNQV